MNHYSMNLSMITNFIIITYSKALNVSIYYTNV